MRAGELGRRNLWNYAGNGNRYPGGIEREGPRLMKMELGDRIGLLLDLDQGAA
jgi:hypothetical protein